MLNVRRFRHSRISFHQLDAWRHLDIEITQLQAQLRNMPPATPPSPLLVELIRLLRVDLYRLVSREAGSRALQRPLPDSADQAQLAQSLDEARLALSHFREAHSANWSEREDRWLVD
ncbi:hypothetical protein [Devosia sp. XK-2]|uniref:hypothetical protein n=1 Tax=Devosia sp. XK-2 TaxID=3126689 RepID=UPI0030D38CCE